MLAAKVYKILVPIPILFLKKNHSFMLTHINWLLQLPVIMNNSIVKCIKVWICYHNLILLVHPSQCYYLLYDDTFHLLGVTVTLYIKTCESMGTRCKAISLQSHVNSHRILHYRKVLVYLKGKYPDLSWKFHNKLINYLMLINGWHQILWEFWKRNWSQFKLRRIQLFSHSILYGYALNRYCWCCLFLRNVIPLICNEYNLHML